MTQEEKPGVVFDCMMYLQAAASPAGPAAASLRLLEAGRFRLFVSAEILREIRDVLGRPRVRSKNPGLTEERVDALFELLAEQAVLVNQVPEQFSYERDPKDEPYVNLALAVGARYLVSRDKDLLDLMNDQDFRSRFPGLTILDPVAFLQELSRADQPEQGPESSP
jgi:putative PIN family toxin of toxin-antitoxin system